jgi:hypothetical protein
MRRFLACATGWVPEALVFVRRPGLRVGLRLTRRSVWHPEVKFAFGDPQERLSVSLLEGMKRRIAGSIG